MSLPEALRVGYVVKRYPRYSETFIVNEILAHERAGLDLEIFSLRPPVDTHFQPAIARVRAPVTYLVDKGKMDDLWRTVTSAAKTLPAKIDDVAVFATEPAGIVFQGIQLALHVHERGIRHLHAHFATSAASVARIAARLADISFSFTAHAKDIFHESVDPGAFRALLRDASSTITVSDFNVDYLRREYGLDAGRVERVYNGLDLELFPYTSPADRPPRILAVGRLVEKKGFGDLIDACGVLAGRGVRFTCQIVGAGELESDLRRRIEQCGLSECVELLGPRPQSEVIALLQDASVFAAPCVVGQDGNRDGLPTVLLEAMALGTPCVATGVTGIPEILHHGETGLLVPQQDPSALARALDLLLEDGALRERLSLQARALIEERFDIHENAAHIRRHFVAAFSSGDRLPVENVILEHVI